jgi:hypothetical protein
MTPDPESGLARVTSDVSVIRDENGNVVAACGFKRGRSRSPTSEYSPGQTSAHSDSGEPSRVMRSRVPILPGCFRNGERDPLHPVRWQPRSASKNSARNSASSQRTHN